MDNNKSNKISLSPAPISPKKLENLMINKCYAPKLIFEDNELSKILREKGIQPGNSLMLKKADGKIYKIETDEGSFSLDRETAAKIIVQN